MIILYEIIFSIGVTYLTYFLNFRLKWGPVKASSFIAIVFGLLYQLLPDYFWTSMPFIAIGSTFIGMVSLTKYYRYFNFIVAPVIFVMLYNNISSNFDGFGGALGTAACCSLIISIYLRSLNTTKRIIRPFRKFKIHTSRRFKK